MTTTTERTKAETKTLRKMASTFARPRERERDFALLWKSLAKILCGSNFIDLLIYCATKGTRARAIVLLVF